MKNGKTLRDVIEELDVTRHEVKIWSENVEESAEIEGGVGSVEIHNRVVEVKLSWGYEFLSSAGGRCAETKEKTFRFDGQTPVLESEEGQLYAKRRNGKSILICSKGRVAPNPSGKL